MNQLSNALPALAEAPRAQAPHRRLCHTLNVEQLAPARAHRREVKDRARSEGNTARGLMSHMEDVAHDPVRPDIMNLRTSSARDEVSPADAKSLMGCRKWPAQYRVHRAVYSNS